MLLNQKTNNKIIQTNVIHLHSGVDSVVWKDDIMKFADKYVQLEKKTF